MMMTFMIDCIVLGLDYIYYIYKVRERDIYIYMYIYVCVLVCWFAGLVSDADADAHDDNIYDDSDNDVGDV